MLGLFILMILVILVLVIIIALLQRVETLNRQNYLLRTVIDIMEHDRLNKTSVIPDK